jgi:hypothetical protein
MIVIKKTKNNENWTIKIIEQKEEDNKIRQEREQERKGVKESVI